MMDGIESFSSPLEGDGGVGPSFLEVTIARSEVVMQGTFLPYAVLLAGLDKALHIQIGKDLKQEHATEQGQQQLFVHDDSRHRDDTSNGQATRVAHENR